MTGIVLATAEYVFTLVRLNHRSCLHRGTETGQMYSRRTESASVEPGWLRLRLGFTGGVPHEMRLM